MLAGVIHAFFIFQVRNLKWLGFRVPLAIVNKAHTANQLYPFAISLHESVNSYERTYDKASYVIVLTGIDGKLDSKVFGWYDWWFYLIEKFKICLKFVKYYFVKRI